MTISYSSYMLAQITTPAAEPSIGALSGDYIPTPVASQSGGFLTGSGTPIVMGTPRTPALFPQNNRQVRQSPFSSGGISGSVRGPRSFLGFFSPLNSNLLIL